ncbi:MAG: putative glycosyltransferase (TIGR04348 family) [Cryomorphaceae bacterium]|jgi:putative glycosyltransferase (TIGR04348 family)
MKIHLATPAKKKSRSGNRASALRWAAMLRDKGHVVHVDTDYSGEPTDLLIALHAWRSAAAIDRYRKHHPTQALIVALGGTDVNGFLKSDPETTLRSIHAADALVGLHDLIAAELPVDQRKKLHIIRQSALPLSAPRQSGSRYFDVCVIGHLREEKDPFRTARAARLMADTSRVRVIHLGKAHNQAWEQQAQKEMAENPRYHWKGEVAGWQVRREFSRTQLMVISSIQEGGANVVSEAIVAGVPVIASDIAGNIGLLGADYTGLYPVGDEQALAELLHRVENNPAFLARLQTCGQRLAPLFSPAHEASAWAKLVASL